MAPNIYQNYHESRVNCKIYQAQSPRWRDTWSGNMVSEFSAIAMYFVGGVVFKKYRESENQKPREYLYRSVLVFLHL